VKNVAVSKFVFIPVQREYEIFLPSFLFQGRGEKIKNRQILKSLNSLVV